MALSDFRLVELRVFNIVLTTHRNNVVEIFQERLIIVAHSAVISVQDSIDPGTFVLDLQHFVDLLLVFADDEPRLGVLQDVLHFLRYCVLVNRDGNRADRLCCDDRPVQSGSVVADDRNAVAALQAQCFEAARNGFDFAGHFVPRPGLPDAEVLLAHGWTVGSLFRVP